MSKLKLGAMLLLAFMIGGAAVGGVFAAMHSGEEVRVAAQRLEDGRVEVAVQQKQADGSWGERLLPELRFVPAAAPTGSWLVSSAVQTIAPQSAMTGDSATAEAVQDDGQQEQPEQEAAAPQGPPPDEMTEIAHGVYHFWGSTYSSLVVISGDDVLISDPSTPLRVPGIKAKIAEVTDNPVNMIVLTHEHYDHAGGTEEFPDATLYVQEQALPVFDLMALAPKPDVDQTFDKFLSIPVGDTVVELHYLGPGDGDATTIIWMPNEGVLHTADMYEPRALTGAAWVDDKNFAGVHKILNELSTWDIKYAINGHSPGNSIDALAENTAYYNDLYDAVINKINETVEANPGNPFAIFGLLGTIRELVQLPQYSDWANYDTAFPAHVWRMFMSIFHGD